MSEASGKVRIAVDAMGGDYAPAEVVRGAVLAAQKGDVEIVLVGPEDVLGEELARYDSSDNLAIRCVDATEVIGENESPAMAIRRKPNCSIAIAAKLVRSGDVDALVGAGYTGAVAVSAIQFIGMVEGIERPTIGGTLGAFANNTIVMDIGANVDCKPRQLLAFAIAGSVFAKNLLHIPNPTVALLSTGAEEGKGSELVRESYSMLKSSGLNFIGNIEGSDILSGRANVVICDGFVGNVVIKFYESIGEHALVWAKHKLKRYPPLGRVVKALFSRLFPIPKLGYESEEEGAGILWGIDGVVRIAHGSSRAPHIAHAIAGARDAVKANIIGCLKSEVAKLREEGKL